ncbi:hypothetical protein [Alterisphingorhabdus coralli]|uniref:Ribbon-helix-helix protein, CopG family n=1 Tax=Alterisphingorhabdus coralli TaxID=3071408 RepID=A0AA97F8P8_9SPHN|nr:hypothetical protein [Parasphingorhabdus sp. SCSIO 66989]WOE75561.1 hypothetical protein RB602_02270 [Parasphingorhabdus sp. SCSIO 66989]
MVQRKPKLNIRVDNEMLEWLRFKAEASGKSLTEVTCDYIEHGIAAEQRGYCENIARNGLVTEYCQIVLEMLAQKHFPTKLDEIVEVAKKRQRQFYMASARDEEDML